MSPAQTPRVTPAKSTLHLRPGTYRVEDLLGELETMHGRGEAEVEVELDTEQTVGVTLSPQVEGFLDRMPRVTTSPGGQTSLPMDEYSPGREDFHGQVAWLDNLPAGTVVRDMTTQRQLTKEPLGVWLSASGKYPRTAFQLATRGHTFHLIKKGTK